MVSPKKLRDQETKEVLEAMGKVTGERGALSGNHGPGPMMSAGNPTRDLVREVGRLKRALSESEAVNESLKAAGGGIALLDPKVIAESRYRDRLEAGFKDKAFQDLRESIRASELGSNEVPIRVRPLPEPLDGCTYEVVYGHRRRRACLELGIKVRAEIVDMDDRAAMLAMRRENKEREALSLYEEAVALERMLESGHFPEGQNEFARLQGMSQGYLSKILAIARFEGYVLEALADPRELKARSAQDLRAAIGHLGAEQAQKKLQGAVKAAKRRLSVQEALEALVGGAPPAASFTLPGQEDPVLDAVVKKRRTDVRVYRELTEEQLQAITNLVGTF